MPGPGETFRMKFWPWFAVGTAVGQAFYAALLVVPVVVWGRPDVWFWAAHRC